MERNKKRNNKENVKRDVSQIRYRQCRIEVAKTASNRSAMTTQRYAKDNGKFINVVVWILKTGSLWMDLPQDYGKWGTVHQRFIRWQRKGMWKKLFEILKGGKNFEWLMIDSSYVKAHQHAAGARGGNQAISKTKGGSIRKYTQQLISAVCL